MSTETPTRPRLRRIIPRVVATPKRAGGRPKSYLVERVQLNTRTLKETRDRLAEQAKRRGVSINAMVDRALEESLVRWEKEKVQKEKVA